MAPYNVICLYVAKRLLCIIWKWKQTCLDPSWYLYVIYAFFTVFCVYCWSVMNWKCTLNDNACVVSLALWLICTVEMHLVSFVKHWISSLIVGDYLTVHVFVVKVCFRNHWNNSGPLSQRAAIAKIRTCRTVCTN